MVLKKISWAVIFVLLVIFIGYGAIQVTPQYHSFAVVSGSMEPEIPTGSLIFTKNVPPENIETGDTITFQEGSTFISHKVVQKNTSSEGETLFVTKGAANDSPDPGFVSGDQVVGKKIFHIERLGYFTERLNDWTGLALAVLFGLLLIARESRVIISEIKNGSDS